MTLDTDRALVQALADVETSGSRKLAHADRLVDEPQLHTEVTRHRGAERNLNMSKKKQKFAVHRGPVVTTCARQGDVLLLRREGGVPDGAVEKARDAGRVILAYGEVTGHAHAIHDRNVCSLRAEGVAGDILRVTEGLVSLVHEEHATITIARGVYEVRIQREYGWAEQASRTVVD